MTPMDETAASPAPALPESGVEHATVRDGGDEWHIECRFVDGQKFAAIKVDYEHEALADFVAAALATSAPAPAPAPAPVDAGGLVARLVKPLRWRPASLVGCELADSAVGRYSALPAVPSGDDTVRPAAWIDPRGVERPAVSIEAARAAAQADYADRILSALDASALAAAAEREAALVRERDAYARETGELRSRVTDAIRMTWPSSRFGGATCPDDKDIVAACSELYKTAHAAEARVTAAKAEREKMQGALVKIERLGSDGEHSGDRHAQCRAIAQSALAVIRKETT